MRRPLSNKTLADELGRTTAMHFAIELDGETTIGASDSGPVAYAMYRAAAEEHLGRRISLKRGGVVLTATQGA